MSGLPRGCESSERTCHNDGETDEHECPHIGHDRRIDTRLEKSRAQRGTTPARRDQSRNAAEQRKEERLGDELRDEARTTDAERETNRDFAPASEGTCEQEVRHIRA